MATPKLVDWETLRAMGYSEGPQTNLKEWMLKNLRITDEQQAINMGKWYNLPYGTNQKLLERILYYRGQLIFWYWEEIDRFMITPFAPYGPIDCYGRFTRCKPLPFNGSNTATKDDKKDAMTILMELKELIPVYDIRVDDMTYEDYTNSCVIITDYSRQISQTVLPRQQLIDPILDLESCMLPYCKTALMNSTGIGGLVVNSQDEESNVEAASRSVEHAALTGKKWIALLANLQIQDLTGGDPAKSEEFLMAFQSVDNFRQGLHGIDNGGVFLKKAHELQTEADMNTGGSSLVLDDKTSCRQEACDIINSVWGLGVWYMPSETVIGMDTNMDGFIGEDDTVEQYSSEGGTDELQQ